MVTPMQTPRKTPPVSPAEGAVPNSPESPASIWKTPIARAAEGIADRGAEQQRPLPSKAETANGKANLPVDRRGMAPKFR